MPNFVVLTQTVNINIDMQKMFFKILQISFSFLVITYKYLNVTNMSFMRDMTFLLDNISTKKDTNSLQDYCISKVSKCAIGNKLFIP